MNSFDLIVILASVGAIAAGFSAGLLRSTATILAHLIAVPTAVFLLSLVPADGYAKLGSQSGPSWPIFFAVFLIASLVLGKCMRVAIDDAVGGEIGLGDRFAGAALGAVRAAIVAITFVMAFDQLAPANVQPAYLANSQLRPILSAAAQKGFASLPPDIVAYVDRLKRERRI
jgi:membrane protein required for colicin V production